MIYFDECPNCKCSDINLYIKNATDKLHGVAGYWDYYICKKCNLIFQKNLIKENIKTYYPKKEYYTSIEDGNNIIGIKYNTIMCFYSENRIKLHKKIIYRAFKNIIQGIPKFVKNGKVLDIGCGNGKTLNILKSIGWDTYGFELNPRSVQIIQKNGHKVVCDLESCNIEFDAILMQHVVEHIYDFKKTINLLNDLLKENGELIITMPNSKSLNFNLFKDCWFPLECPRHVQLLYPSLLEDILQKNGFEVKKIFYTGQLNEIVKSLQYKYNINLFFSSIFYLVPFLLNVLKIGDEFQINARKKRKN